MNSARLLTATDTVANLTSASLTLSTPLVWDRLGLPERARVPAGVALVASGLHHASGLAGSRPLPAQQRGGIAINGAWVVAGLAAQRLPLTGWQRAVLGTIAAYDVAMVAAKLTAYAGGESVISSRRRTR